MAEFDPVQFERPFWEPIGIFVIQFGYLEHNVDWAVTALLQIHMRQGEAVTSQILSLRARTRLVEKLCYLITADDTHRSEISNLVGKIQELNSFRNRLLHGAWGAYVSPPKGEGYWQKTYVRSQDFKYKSFDVRLDKIIENTSEITQTGIRLMNLVQEIIRNRQTEHTDDP